MNENPINDQTNSTNSSDNTGIVKCEKCMQNPCICDTNINEHDAPKPNAKPTDQTTTQPESKRPKISWI
jgi:hypothetical protein